MQTMFLVFQARKDVKDVAVIVDEATTPQYITFTVLHPTEAHFDWTCVAFFGESRLYRHTS